ncbi:MAG: 50S ribosomal protein L11 methyltransferase [Chitinophagales bacterium]
MAWKAYYISPLKDDKAEQMSSLLFNLGADGIEEDEAGIKAYFEDSNLSFAEIELEIKALPGINGCSIESSLMPDTNWNAEWEKNYAPVLIDDKVMVRASFHQPDQKFSYDILIDPKMLFGTAHHATTESMIRVMLDIDMKRKRVLDFGCGTAVLAILAEKMGAKNVTAIDYDEWAFENSKENIAKNHCQKIDLKCGNAEELLEDKYDVILANVTRNVIMSNAHTLKKHLKPSGYLLLSGLLEADEAPVLEKIEGSELKKLTTLKKDNWIAIVLKAA